MGFRRRFNDTAVTKTALQPTGATTAANFTTAPISAGGYNRARFVFSLAQGGANAKLDAQIYNASTSGATFTSVTNAALTQISTGAGSGINAIIDMAIDPANPWLCVSGALTSSTWPYSCTVDLYRPDRAPGTSLSQQVVSV